MYIHVCVTWSIQTRFCYIDVPAIGGPIRVANPWNIRSKPNELTNISSPSRSTNTTDVNETYTPE